jgi:hypothetical protein
MCCFVLLQLTNDIEKAKADIAAAEKRQQELQQLVAQAKQGKEDTVRGACASNNRDDGHTAVCLLAVPAACVWSQKPPPAGVCLIRMRSTPLHL